MTDQELVDAATVMPLRPADDGFEVFMVRRHGDSGFMANRYVYPGGKLDADDCTERVLDHVEGMTPEQARDRLGEDIEPLRALGLFLAGIRETFEEAGLLLARRRGDEEFVDLVSDDETARHFERAREALASGELSISEFADREDLVIPLDRIGYFAHWVTPFVEKRRYDTRFFVVLAPERQEPLHGDRETTDSAWMRPEDVIDENRNGDLKLAPPTLRTLQQLAEFDSAEAALEFAQTHRPPTLLPHMAAIEGEIYLLLPDDPAYPSDDPKYAISEPSADDVTRLRMLDMGHWSVDRDQGPKADE